MNLNERVQIFVENWRAGSQMTIEQMKTQRMIRGECKHGSLDLENDPRDFVREGIEELIDFLNYWEFAMLQGKVSFCKWSEIDEWIRIALCGVREEKLLDG